MDTSQIVIFLRRCVEVCPVKCLSMDNVYFPAVRTRTDGKYLRVLPPGVLPAYQKAKEAAKSQKPKEVKSEEVPDGSGARESEKEERE
jgi:formate hydrogenlyase subunit 6/NADH:ubiquinone oxidoreductase subunit I